jgi:LuxR family maltose regulon positive regulatory protein
MGRNATLRRQGRSLGTPRPRAEPLAAVLATGEVSRAPLVNRLRAARSQPVAVIVAPAGYGKTALLAQWDARDDRSFAHVALDRRGTPAAVLVELLVKALAGLGAQLAVPRKSRAVERWIWRAAVPRLAAALRAIEGPFVLVVDDAHRLEQDAAEVLTALVQHVPERSMLVVAGRTPPLPSLPRLRASGELLELDTADLAFNRREARALLQALGATGSEERLDRVLERTEGWPAGVRLAALSLETADRPRSVRAAVTGADLSGYVQAEYLGALTPEQRVFVRRTSILGRMCGPLCNAVLERRDSARVLGELERSNVLVALGRGREWFRYHHAVQEQLRRELEEYDGWLVPQLERKAAAWFHAHGDPERALDHAHAAGDAVHVAQLLDAAAVAMHNDGRDEALLRWIGLLEEAVEIEGHPEVAVLAARLHGQRGHVSEAERFLAAAIEGAAARGSAPGAPLSAHIDLVRAATCADGVEAMLSAAESALGHVPADDCWRAYGLLLQGSAYALLGERERADAILGRAVHAARRFGSTETSALALTERALVAAAEGERVRAGQLLDLARDEIALGGLEAYPTSALTLAASARLELLHGHSPEAFAALEQARALLPGLGDSLPWLAVQARLELVEADVTLRDLADARAVLAEVDELLDRCPRLGTLRHRRDALASELESAPGSTEGKSVGLTAAELRLVPMLATHLSFREIGARFYLSRNTVKTQAISVYRKLGASSRSEAVARAYDLGLIDAGAETTVS